MSGHIDVFPLKKKGEGLIRGRCLIEDLQYTLLTKLVWSRWLDIGQVLFFVFNDHKNAKKERGHYTATLAKQAWSIKDLLYRQTENFFAGPRREISCGQDGPILPLGWPIGTQNSLHLARSQIQLYINIRH